jgi:GNAT superfamily N-acetyltransferase
MRATQSTPITVKTRKALTPILRLATLDDIPTLQPLMVRSVMHLSRGFYTEEQTRAAATYITIPHPEIIRDDTYYVVEDEGQIVGCGGWSRRKKLFTGSADQESLTDWLDPATEPAKIRAMFTDPELKQRGVGRLIYSACEEAALQAGFRQLELMATLPGVPFYRKVGFQEIEPVDILLPDGSSLPCLRMSKLLGLDF